MDPISPTIQADRIGAWQIRTLSGSLRVPIFRPRVIEVQSPPPTIVDTSNSRVRWRSQIVVRDPGLVLETPRGNPWTEHIAEVRFFTHQSMSPVEARRIALGSDASIRFRDGRSLNKQFSFEADGAAAALGFSIAVDGMCLRLRLPEALWSDLGDGSERAIRTARFHDLAVDGPYLEAVDNPFAREWLAHLLLAALSNEAIAKSISLRQSAENLANGTADLSLGQTLAIMFQSPVVDDANGQGNQQDRLRQDLSGFPRGSGGRRWPVPLGCDPLDPGRRALGAVVARALRGDRWRGCLQRDLEPLSRDRW